MKNPISIELLEKYVNGQCSEEEMAIVKAWYFSFDKEQDPIPSLSVPEEQQLEEAIYNRILHNIGMSEEPAEPDQPETADDRVYELPARRRFKAWYAVAGIAATLLVVFSVWLVNFKNGGVLMADRSQSSDLVVINNDGKQLYKATLPDNSVVWLSPGAQLRYPKTFAAKYRAVRMNGECFFEVTKNPGRPFIISSHSIITKVWGTSFRVRDDAARHCCADVSVVTGKVSVSIKNADSADVNHLVLKKGDVMLYPHQRVVYLADKNQLRPELSSNEPALQIWNRVNLNFENKPLSEIVPVLNAQFHVNIKMRSEKLNHYILNADMEGFNLPDILEAFKKSLNVDYQMKDNNIELE
ncbi:FecR family protein [Mucilaginibacter yixingensis]|uniref:FecR family protein n=1 Tax=Mucilaginibacter yixingensis TaxID=1295612 RepID=A0A2T5JE75_9SPHI|nr:FecR family protein [Mucilaginibacter yixingensis]PTQ99955.1 FecR family protein [Mucilaginibacter yixingensis]